MNFLLDRMLLACLLCFFSVHTPNSWSRCTRKHINIFWKLFATCFMCNACVGFFAFASASAFASRVWNRLKTWKDHRTKWHRHNTNHCICVKFHHLCQCLIFGCYIFPQAPYGKLQPSLLLYLTHRDVSFTFQLLTPLFKYRIKAWYFFSNHTVPSYILKNRKLQSS